MSTSRPFVAWSSHRNAPVDGAQIADVSFRRHRGVSACRPSLVATGNHAEVTTQDFVSHPDQGRASAARSSGWSIKDKVYGMFGMFGVFWLVAGFLVQAAGYALTIGRSHTSSSGWVVVGLCAAAMRVISPPPCYT
jgi:hypothetical protein